MKVDRDTMLMLGGAAVVGLTIALMIWATTRSLSAAAAGATAIATSAVASRKSKRKIGKRTDELNEQVAAANERAEERAEGDPTVEELNDRLEQL